MVKPLSMSFVLCFILLASLIYRFLKSNIYNSVTMSHSSKSMSSPQCKTKNHPKFSFNVK